MTARILSPTHAAERLANGAQAVDLRPHADYLAGHVPGAVRLSGAKLSRKNGAVGGLLPDDESLGRTLGAIGLTPDTEVVAYDAEGAASGRLLWVLDVVGHRAPVSLLDGGVGLWQDAGLDVLSGATHRQTAQYAAVAGTDAVADSAYILGRLSRDDVVVLDVRTPEEFRGEDVRSQRGGHVPGAVNLDWRELMHLDRHRALRSNAEILARLAAQGVQRDKEVVVYCQTHQRSSHTYAVLKHLGFERVRGYPGAWSDWGNNPALPIEVGE